MKTAKLLAPVLEMKEEELLEKLTMNLSAIYLKRKVTPETSQAVRELELPGIIFTPEGQRFYPNGTLASQLLGFVGMDEGLAGLEVYYEEQLKGKEGYLLFPSDHLNRPIPHEIKRFVPPKEGMDLYLTIDETVQYIVERELARAMIEFQPKAVMAIAADPRTGAILAAASKPDYDPLHYEKYDSKYWALPPITSSFEPGSTFKLITLCAVEEGLYNSRSIIFAAASPPWAATISTAGPAAATAASAISRRWRAPATPPSSTWGSGWARRSSSATSAPLALGSPRGSTIPGRAAALFLKMSSSVLWSWPPPLSARGYR